MHPTLNNFIPAAKLISQTFDCEVILHDFVKEVLLSRKFHDDCCANYIMEGKDEKKSNPLPV